MPIFPFNVLTYRVNPYIAYLNQNFTLLPSPGFSAASYSVSGTLPAGVVFNTNTGAFTGPATAITPATTLTVTANLIGGGTSVCTLPMQVVEMPPQAIAANQASATGLTNNILLQEQNFLTCAEQMINQNAVLGKFSATFDLQDLVSFRWVYFYFSKLNYTVENLTPNNDDLGFMSYFGALPSFPGPAEGPFGPWFDGYPYPDFGQYFPATVVSHPVRKVRISWSQYSGYCSFPYSPWPNYPYPF